MFKHDLFITTEWHEIQTFWLGKAYFPKIRQQVKSGSGRGKRSLTKHFQFIQCPWWWMKHKDANFTVQTDIYSILGLLIFPTLTVLSKYSSWLDDKLSNSSPSPVCCAFVRSQWNTKRPQKKEWEVVRRLQVSQRSGVRPAVYSPWNWIWHVPTGQTTV